MNQMESAQAIVDDLKREHKKQLDELKKQFQEYNAVAGKLRSERLDLVYKIILMISVIVGFSATLLGTNSFSAVVDVPRLILSWVVLLSDIVLGFLLMLTDNIVEWQIEWNAFLQRIGNKSEGKLKSQNRIGLVRQKMLPYMPFLFYTIFIVGLVIFVSAFAC